MNEIHVTLRGNVAGDPRHVRFDDGGSLTSFRLASNARRFDRESSQWVDKDTTYVSVVCRKSMALNAVASVRKGQPVVVTGRLRERSWTSNGRSGQTLEVEAETLGHDLSFGTTQFVRIPRSERAASTAGESETSSAATDAELEPGGPVIDVSGLVVLDPDDDEEPDDVAAEAEFAADLMPA